MATKMQITYVNLLSKQINIAISDFNVEFVRLINSQYS